MRPYLRPLSYLLVPVLLLALNSCSKKDAVEAKNVASYTLDGQTKNCLLTQTASTQTSFDYITLSLTTTPQPSSGPEVLELKLWRISSPPNASYDFMDNGSPWAVVYTANQLPEVGYYFTSTTRAYTGSSSKFSGAFTCEARYLTGPTTYTVVHTITGTLINVQL